MHHRHSHLHSRYKLTFFFLLKSSSYICYKEQLQVVGPRCRSLACLLVNVHRLRHSQMVFRQLRRSLSNDDLSIPTYDDLDILEVENRKKVVRHMWELYTQRQNGSGRRSTIRLPRFWQEAFEAAYDPLSSDVPALKNAAVSEIAKMSIRSINVVDSFPLQTQGH